MTRNELADVVAKRHEFLARLLEGGATKPELVAEIDTSRSTVDRAISELSDHGLVEQDGSRYLPTFTGKCVHRAFGDYRGRLADIERAREVLDAFDLGVDLDPDAIDGVEVYEPEPFAPEYPLERGFELLGTASRISGVGPIPPQRVEALAEAVVDRGATVELVVTADAWERAERTQAEALRALLDSEGATLYRTDSAMRYAVLTGETAEGTETELVVYTDTGVGGVLVNDARAMTDWARSTFRRYRDRAARVEGTRSGSATSESV